MRMLNIFVGLTLDTSFGFLLGAIITHAKYADERQQFPRL